MTKPVKEKVKKSVVCLPVLKGLWKPFSGLDISQGTEANGRGALADWPCALADWPCALENSFHIFHLLRPCPAEMAMKMGAPQFSYVNLCILVFFQ
jgi:hypothetical protein